jgi:hypothetical protein
MTLAERSPSRLRALDAYHRCRRRTQFEVPILAVRPTKLTCYRQTKPRLVYRRPKTSGRLTCSSLLLFQSRNPVFLKFG